MDSPHLDRRSFMRIGAAASLTAAIQPLEGLITLIGYNDMSEMLTALDAEFSKRHRGVRVVTDLPGTRFAPDALASGRSTLGPMGARFTPEQLAEFVARTGTQPAGFRIAHASLNSRALSGPNAVFVNRQNPLQSIDLKLLAKLFTEPGRHRWSELGVSGPFEDLPVVVSGLKPSTPLALEFKQAVFPTSPFRTDYAGFGQSRDVIDHIGREPAALAFAALNRASDSVRALGIRRRASSKPIQATPDTLRAGLYPLDRHLWLYARRGERGGLSALCRAYLAFVLSQDGQAIIGSGSLGYLPLGENERRRELAKLGS